MIAMQEITTGNGRSEKYNHIYLFDGSKAVAYIPHGKVKAIYFNSPMNVHRSRRKFVELEKNPFKRVIQTNLIRIVGSRGDVYHIDPDLKTCTCNGFTFRGRCKHIDSLTPAA